MKAKRINELTNEGSINEFVLYTLTDRQPTDEREMTERRARN